MRSRRNKSMCRPPGSTRLSIPRSTASAERNQKPIECTYLILNDGPHFIVRVGDVETCMKEHEVVTM